MAQHLVITVRFLAEHYHGALWPPAPATLFQALVSGGNTGVAGNGWGDAETEALQWMERLSAPSIAARHANPSKGYRLFVPNNNLDKAVQSEIAGGKTIVKPESLRTVKDVRPHLIARHSPGEANLVYSWPIADAESANAQAHTTTIDALAARLTALGWGVDFAAAQAELTDHPVIPVNTPGWAHFIPAPSGSRILQVPAPGVLHNLDRRFAAFRGRITRDGLNPSLPPAGFQEVHYRSISEPQPRHFLQFDLRVNEDEWLTKSWAKAMHVAGWLRHAAATALMEEEFPEDCITEFAYGHTGSDNLGHRLSYLPLPSIGARHTDGIVRRVLIMAPACLQPIEAEALSLLRLKLSGSPIIAEDESEPLGYFADVLDRNTVYPFYLNSSTVWESVSPVILPGHNALRRQISIDKTERLLFQCLQSAGYPPESIKEINFQPAPFWPGTEAAGRILVPKHLARWPRLHVRIIFQNPVEGPIAIGLGRHYGIGLFAAPRV